MSNGYKVIVGESCYGHYFGGNTWATPLCPICKVPYPQLLTLDVKDYKLNWLTCSLNELPLISCVNCSTCWERQYYYINEKTRSIQLLKVDNTESWQHDEKDRFKYPFHKIRMKLDLLNSFDEDEIIESMGRDYICKLGGEPVFLNDPIETLCPKCEKEMQYVGEYSGVNPN